MESMEDMEELEKLREKKLQGRILVSGYSRRSDQITPADGQTPVCS